MPKSKSRRAIRLTQPPDARGVGTLCITDGKGECVNYVFREIPCQIGGRGFELHKLGIGGILYHTRAGNDPNEECSCECMGWLRNGHCKHVAGLLALIKQGKI